MTEPIRIRSRTADGLTEVRILMPHPMETGMRQGSDGVLLPAHHITEVRVTVADRPVFAASMSYAVAQDPLLSFRFRGGRPGERLRVSWTDNLGEQRSDDALLG